MKLAEAIARWPVVRQLREGDPLGLGRAVQSDRSRRLRPRIEEADHVVQSICPYCAVGCGQLVYVKDGEVSHIEGDPASPISRGRLCPKGQASKLVRPEPAARVQGQVPPALRHPLGGALARRGDGDDRRPDRRDACGHLGGADESDAPANRTMAIGNLGGATLDNEENYLIKKLCVALGIVQVENQARI